MTPNQTWIGSAGAVAVVAVSLGLFTLGSNAPQRAQGANAVAATGAAKQIDALTEAYDEGKMSAAQYNARVTALARASGGLALANQN